MLNLILEHVQMCNHVPNWTEGGAGGAWTPPTHTHRNLFYLGGALGATGL